MRTEELIGKISNKLVFERDKQLLKDIIDIYNGKYKDYEEYFEHHKNVLEAIYDTMEKYPHLAFIEPQLLSREYFYEIMPLYNRKQATIKECIKLLKVSGNNTKQIVLDKLKELVLEEDR